MKTESLDLAEVGENDELYIGWLIIGIANFTVGLALTVTVAFAFIGLPCAVIGFIIIDHALPGEFMLDYHE